MTNRHSSICAKKADNPHSSLRLTLYTAQTYPPMTAPYRLLAVFLCFARVPTPAARTAAEAYRWFLEAAQQGNADAAKALAVLASISKLDELLFRY
jgi:TPR repeat protein